MKEIYTVIGNLVNAMSMETERIDVGGSFISKDEADKALIRTRNAFEDNNIKVPYENAVYSYRVNIYKNYLVDFPSENTVGDC